MTKLDKKMTYLFERVCQNHRTVSQPSSNVRKSERSVADTTRDLDACQLPGMQRCPLGHPSRSHVKERSCEKRKVRQEVHYIRFPTDFRDA